MARDLTRAILASPNQASRLFGVGSAHPIKQKSLFVMRFLRKVGEGGAEWKDGLSFLVKSIDRPTVQPVVEELNQYNKKRMIHTGLKYSPVTCVLYDTADGAAMSMWVQYAQYHYGDYRQDAASYADDIVSARMFGSGRNNYGFGISAPSSSAIDGINTQFFFDRIDVYQLWGGEYTCFQLLNPRINNFDPDDLDYENSGAAMITMGINYEAIYHENGGKPARVSSNPVLTEMFGGALDGETFDPQPSATRTTSFASVVSPLSTTLSGADIQTMLGGVDDAYDSDVQTNDITTSSGGALSRYGVFDFGNFLSMESVLPPELSLLSNAPTLDVGALDAPFPKGLTTKQANELELARLIASQRRANVDAVSAALPGTVSKIPDIAQGVGYASILTSTSPMDQVKYDDNAFLTQSDYDSSFTMPVAASVEPVPAPVDAVVTTTDASVVEGLSLSSLTVAVVNSASNGKSQIGQRRSTINPLLAYVVEPTPSTILTPDIVFGIAKAQLVIKNTSKAIFANSSYIVTRIRFTMTAQGNARS